MTIEVPWNASWSSERSFEIRPCRWAHGKLAVWQPHSPGIGRPIFAKPHFVRQRRSIFQMVCSVCGKRTPPLDRWWFALGEQVDGRWFATSESPVHRACADVALAKCPHLSKGRHADNLSPLPLGYRILAVRVGGDEFERDFGLKTSGREIIGGLKLAWPREMIQFKAE